MTFAPDWKKAGVLAKAAIRSAELKRLYVYSDGFGNLTMGIGHKLTAEELKRYRFGDTITDELAESLYDGDFNIAFNAVVSLHQLHPANMNAPRIAVLIEMAFCLGATGLANFDKMFEAIGSDDWKQAGQEIINSRWFEEQGAKFSGIRDRIKRLAKQMETGAVIPIGGKV